ncbi:MAG: class I SAM-dependent methyltransferase [Bacteroidetes bacterium]|nr:class I SAM-dependent methyltransferase [Bacteroidota bacterium]
MQIFDSCPICKTKKISDFKKFGKSKLDRCSICKIVFQNPQPGIEELRRYYIESYLDSISSDGITQNYSYVKAAAEFHLTGIEKRYGKINSILEVGCGKGQFLSAAKELGYTVNGIEISQDGCRFAKSQFGLDIFNGTLEEFRTEKKFDLIIFNHSLEHLPDPLFAIRRSFELLSKKGVVWIVLPNLSSTDRFVHGDKWDGWHLPYHLFHFNPKSLKYLLSRIPFSQIEIEKTFLSPVKIFKMFFGKEIGGKTTVSVAQIDQVRMRQSRPFGHPYGKGIPYQAKNQLLKNLLRKPATFLFSGQNMTGFAVR